MIPMYLHEIKKGGMKNCHLESSSCKSVVARVLRKSHFYRPEEAMNQQSLLSATRGAPSRAGARANERNYLTNSRDRVTSSPPGKKKVNLQKTSSHSKNERGQVKQVVACVLTSFCISALSSKQRSIPEGAKHQQKLFGPCRRKDG
ncbi:hypothetical protein CDAR_211831 [Caerostris darwini]|uniref:Uncharacterized protein n=1 Tax=Caerostris darwini TaxID=1538125 RepID=A0AAV4PCP9_9ARAC|nr:hypothetical protein CDAR_211831 [Caerostris darwini]